MRAGSRVSRTPGRAPHRGAAPHGAEVQTGGEGESGPGLVIGRGASRSEGSSGQRRGGKEWAGRPCRARRLTGSRFKQAGTGGATRPGAAPRGAKVQTGNDGGSGPGRRGQVRASRGRGPSGRQRRERTGVASRCGAL